MDSSDNIRLGSIPDGLGSYQTARADERRRRQQRPRPEPKPLEVPEDRYEPSQPEDEDAG